MRSASSARSTLDALPLDGVAPLQFGGLDRFGALDFEPAGFLLGPDALGGDRLLLGDARGLDRFAGGDVGLLDGAVAGDFERANALLLGDAGGLGRLARGDAGDLERLVALDFQLAAWPARRAMRSAASVRSRAIRAASTACCASISASWMVRTCCDLQRAGALVGGDALDIDVVVWAMRGLFGRLAGRDLGLVDRAGALDLAPPGLLLVGDARRR